MGLFDFVGELLVLPLNIAATTVRTAVKVTGAVITLDPAAGEKALDDALKDAMDKAEDLERAADE